MDLRMDCWGVDLCKNYPCIINQYQDTHQQWRLSGLLDGDEDEKRWLNKMTCSPICGFPLYLGEHLLVVP